MQHITSSAVNPVPRKIIWRAGLLAGTLDIFSAFVDFWLSTGRGPGTVLRYIASGVFGADAFAGNMFMPAAGLLFHYLIAFCWTFLFFRLRAKIPLMHRNRFITGIGFTLLVWMVMNLAVVPLSRVNHVPITSVKPFKLIKSFLILLFMIGWPLAFIARSAEIKETEKK